MAPWPLSWIVGSDSASAADGAPSPRSDKQPPPTASKPQHGSVTTLVKGSGGRTDPQAGPSTEEQTAVASWAALLEPYKGTGRLPEKARTDPNIRQRVDAPVAHLWEYVPFFAKQGE